MKDNIEGRADRVLRQLIAAGKTDEVIDILASVVDKDRSVDISVPFRVGLIAQGFEREAMLLSSVTLIFHNTGFLIQFTPTDNGEWLDSKSPELDAAFTQANVWVMRAGNIDAFVDDDGDIDSRGRIIPSGTDEVETMVSQFKAEIDEQFPDHPSRQGKWW